MTKKNVHWTNENIENFQYSIAADFVMQIEKRMNSSADPVSSKELAERLGVTPGRVSQVLNDPCNLELKTIIKYSRALGMKVAVVAYDDRDPDNDSGPVNSEIFQICWERQGSPINFFKVEEVSQKNMTLMIPAWAFPYAKDRSVNRIKNTTFLGEHTGWQEEAVTLKEKMI